MTPTARAEFAPTVLDVLATSIAFLLATLATFSSSGDGMSFEEFLSMRIELRNFALFLAMLGLWHVIFYSLRRYDSRRTAVRGWPEAAALFRATTLAVAATALVALVFNIEIVTPTFLLVFGALIATFAAAGRLVFRYALQGLRLMDRDALNAVVIGTNERARAMAEKLVAKPERGYKFVGFVDEAWSGGSGQQEPGVELVSDFDSFQDFVRNNIVDEVFIFTPVKSLYERASRIVTCCEEQGITVRFDPEIFPVSLGRLRLEWLYEDALVTVKTGAMRGSSVIVKRLLDFGISLLSLIALSPLMVVIALIIKSTSPGPVLFVGERLGLNKRRFRMYKFRTMAIGADSLLATLEHLNEADGPVFKIKSDPRITSIGHFLRRTSLDELPQLINVLKGDMSLVGPRPLPIRDYEGFEQDWHRRRFSVRPGMTCLWQIQGRSALTFDRWMALDMQYIDQWSLWLDLTILMKTLPAVLKGSGAY